MKKIRLWIELIFIFLLPLIFMLLSIEIKTSNTIDANNNITETKKYIDIKNINFLYNGETIEYKKYNYYTENETITFNENTWVYLDIQNLYYYEELEYLKIGMYEDDGAGEIAYLEMYAPTFPVLKISNEEQDQNNTIYYTNYIMIDDGYPTIETKFYITKLNGQLIWYRMDNSEELPKIQLKANETYYILNNTEHNVKIIKNIETYTINNSPIANILNSLYNALGIRNNIIVQLITIYILLFVIMFLVWHLFYLPYDIIIHMFSKE